MSQGRIQDHPAYLELTPDERAAVDLRLGAWPLDHIAVKAATGAADSLEATDLRWWLESTARRPWTPMPTAAQSATVEALVAAFRAAADGDLTLPRAFVRAAIITDSGRSEQGLLREEQLAALSRRIDALGHVDRRWSESFCLRALHGNGLEGLAEALGAYHRERTGIRGLLSRAAERMGTHLFDLAQGGLYLATGAADHEGHFADGVWRNWTNNYSVQPNSYLRPQSEAELCQVVGQSQALRVVGGGHTFNDSPLSPDTLISLDAYDAVLSIDRAARTARVQAGIRLRDLNTALWAAGLGLPVLGSTDAQSIAGLICTDLHGSGRDHGFLSEQVLSLRIIDAAGVARTHRPGDPIFHAAFGALGTMGIIVEVELQLVPAFHIAKSTAMVDRAQVEAEMEALLAHNEHLSFYYVGGGERCDSVRMHRWNRTTEPLTPDWQKQKARAELTDFAISAALPGVAEVLASLDEDGFASDTLAPDHRLVMPGSMGFGRRLFYRHDEIEYGLPFEVWRACTKDIIDMLSRRRFFSIVELRFTPDQSAALLGPGVGRPTAYIELATPLSQFDAEVYAEADEIFLRYGGQPHLGKKTNYMADQMLAVYGDRYTRFQALRRQQDPTGKLLNPFTRRVFGETGAPR